MLRGGKIRCTLSIWLASISPMVDPSYKSIEASLGLGDCGQATFMRSVGFMFHFVQDAYL